MKDCTFIKNELVDQMTIGKKYELSDLYRMIETSNSNIEDCRHKVRAVLEQREISGKYQVIYHGNAVYSLVRMDAYEKFLDVKEVA